jgi:predicted RNA-binding protein with RPS1 domain
LYIASSKRTFDLPSEGITIRGKVIKIESFGAFVSMPNYSSQGLIHISQLSRERVENPSEVVSIGDDVFVKVMVAEITEGKPRISLSMKYLNQTDGTDQDPNGIYAELDEKKKRKFNRFEPEPIHLEAIYNTICSKCGGSGHIAAECYNQGQKKYDLLPLDEDVDKSMDQNTRWNGESSWDNKSSVNNIPTNSNISRGIGRGRASTLPSWMKPSILNTTENDVSFKKIHNDDDRNYVNISDYKDMSDDSNNESRKHKSKKDNKKHKHKHKDIKSEKKEKKHKKHKE